ncbi:MAG: hypothetical protein RIT45_3943 [Pseudomonadota bacterium]
MALPRTNPSLRRWAAVATAALLLGCGKDKGDADVAAAAPPPPPPPPPSALMAMADGGGGAADPEQPTPGFVRVPDAQTLRGSPPAEAGRSEDELQHRVTVRRPFEMAATEVTIEDYAALVGSKPAARQGCDRCPVDSVSWFEAAHFCNELSKRRGLPTCYVIGDKRVDWVGGVDCRGFRLPTEAEWEHAARGGVAAARYGEVDAVAWIDTNSDLHSHEVGKKQPNAYGLYDMLGNVAEWVWDWQAPYPKDGGVDPIGPSEGQNRVFRGGAYRWTADEARAAFRNAYGPLNKVEWIGFRCVRTLSR